MRSQMENHGSYSCETTGWALNDSAFGGSSILFNDYYLGFGVFAGMTIS